MNLQESKTNEGVFYSFVGLSNTWVSDNDRTYKDNYFKDKTYEDFYFDSFYDMDKEFGHENSLFGTRGLPVGHPKRKSSSFDMYYKQYGPAIVRVVKDTNLQENIRRILREEISAKEAYSTYGSIKTIIDGKRDVAFIELNNIVNRLLISLKSLKKIKVPSSIESNYIVYREGSEKEAQELYDIAMKYDGSLSYIASEEDSRRIGQILGYKQDDIEDYIKHNKKIRGITENIQRIQEMMGNKKDSSVKVFNYKKYTLILSKNPCDIFTHFKVEDLHGLNYQKCLSHKNTKEDAYIAGLANKTPKTKKDFLFLNLNRLGKDKEKMGLIMHETMHLSLGLHKHDVNKKEEEIITWAEKEAYKIYDIIKKL